MSYPGSTRSREKSIEKKDENATNTEKRKNRSMIPHETFRIYHGLPQYVLQLVAFSFFGHPSVFYHTSFIQSHRVNDTLMSFLTLQFFTYSRAVMGAASIASFNPSCLYFMLTKKFHVDCYVG
jgi:hypothetical protein